MGKQINKLAFRLYTTLDINIAKSLIKLVLNVYKKGILFSFPVGVCIGDGVASLLQPKFQFDVLRYSNLAFEILVQYLVNMFHKKTTSTVKADLSVCKRSTPA